MHPEILVTISFLTTWKIGWNQLPQHKKEQMYLFHNVKTFLLTEHLERCFSVYYSCTNTEKLAIGKGWFYYVNLFYSFQYRCIHTIHSHHTTRTQVGKVIIKIIHDKVLLHIMPHQTGMPILTTLKIFNHKGKFLYYRNGNFWGGGVSLPLPMK